MEYKVFIQFGDTDPAGIVYYPNYYRWMDAATHNLLKTIGYPTETLANDNIITPLVETHCLFEKPAYYHHELTIKTTISSVKAKVFKLVHKFYNQEQLLAQGYEIRAWVTKTDHVMRATEIPLDVRTKLEKEMQEDVQLQ